MSFGQISVSAPHATRVTGYTVKPSSTELRADSGRSVADIFVNIHATCSFCHNAKPKSNYCIIQ